MDAAVDAIEATTIIVVFSTNCYHENKEILTIHSYFLFNGVMVSKITRGSFIQLVDKHTIIVLVEPFKLIYIGSTNGGTIGGARGAAAPPHDSRFVTNVQSVVNIYA